MDAFENTEAEFRHGLAYCQMKFGDEVMLAVDPKTICMIGGPGTSYCLLGRCLEVVNDGHVDRGGKLRQPETITPIGFYIEGSDERTEVCRRQLREFQESRR